MIKIRLLRQRGTDCYFDGRRPASLIAHLQEETERPIGFIMSGAAAARIDFQPMEG
jgi:hypothetical protein